MNQEETVEFEKEVKYLKSLIDKEVLYINTENSFGCIGILRSVTDVETLEEISVCIESRKFIDDEFKVIDDIFIIKVPNKIKFIIPFTENNRVQHIDWIFNNKKKKLLDKKINNNIEFFNSIYRSN